MTTNGSRPSGAVPYRVLDTATRRRASVVYLGAAGVASLLILAVGINAMWLTAVLPILLLALSQFVGGWRIEVTDMAAIAAAGRHTTFEVGHGSATLGYRGWLAKPVWQVVVYAAGGTPDHQALVVIDALTGEVLGTHEEAVGVP
ncbi:MAG: hypothetical protein R2823_07330 [Acidimicrobiia bacterium]